MHRYTSPLPQSHAFVVRIWWEQGLTQPDGHPLWRGQVQHANSGQSLIFQSLSELVHFIQSQTGGLEDDESVSANSNGQSAQDKHNLKGGTK